MHNGPRILTLPNAWYAASARIFEDAGFQAVGISGPTILVKAGLRMMGANWVPLPILGESCSPCIVPGFAAAERHARHERVDGRARLWSFRRPILSSDSSLRAPDRICGADRVQHLAGVRGAGGDAQRRSMLWLFSSTLLQLRTKIAFGGACFSAEFALSVITMSAANYTTGVIDRFAALAGGGPESAELS